jgi:hypothetical protein
VQVLAGRLFLPCGQEQVLASGTGAPEVVIIAPNPRPIFCGRASIFPTSAARIEQGTPSMTRRRTFFLAPLAACALFSSACNRKAEVAQSPKPTPTPVRVSAEDIKKHRPNEAGAVMVVMYHRILAGNLTTTSTAARDLREGSQDAARQGLPPGQRARPGAEHHESPGRKNSGRTYLRRRLALAI